MNLPALRPPSLLLKYAPYLFWVSLAVYAFTLPISNTIAVRNLAFVLLIFSTLCLCIGARQWPMLPLKRAWAIYGAIALISCLYAVDPLSSLGEIKVEIFYCVLIFSIAFTWAKLNDILPKFAFVAATCNLILVVTALSVSGMDKSWGQILALPGWARAGFNTNYILCVFPLLCYLAWTQWNKGNRRLSAGITTLLALDILAMILSYNRQTMVALAAGIFCAAALLLRNQFTWKRAAAFLGTLCLVAALLATQMLRRAETRESVDQVAHTAVAQDVRWPLWKFSVEKIIEHPLTGGGFGRAVFDKLYPEFMPENTMLWHAHNMLLNKGIQMGIPGILAFLFLWYALLRAFTRYLADAPDKRLIAIAGISTLTIIFMKNMTDDFFLRDMALWFWLVNGILLGSLQNRASHAARPPSQP